MNNKELVKALYEINKRLRSEGNNKDADIINQSYLRLQELDYFKQEASRALRLEYRGY